MTTIQNIARDSVAKNKLLEFTITQNEYGYQVSIKRKKKIKRFENKYHCDLVNEVEKYLDIKTS